MKKMRIPLIAAFALAIVGIVFGSFFDLQISQAIASSTNTLGLTISVIGPTIGFSGLALIGGGFVALALKKDKKTPFLVLFWILAIASYGASVYYAGREYFGPNGFINAAPVAVGYLIAAVPLAGAGYLGYWLFKDNTNPYTWIVLIIALAAIVLTLVGLITVLKEIMHRPRFRAVVGSDIPYHNWWEPCRNYKQLMTDHNLIGEEFKSYPSGHAGEASITLSVLTILPFVCPKLQKIQLPLWCGALVYALLVCLARILAAAHYLSDVSTGLGIGILFAFIANEVIIHVKAFHKDEPVKE